MNDAINYETRNEYVGIGQALNSQPVLTAVELSQFTTEGWVGPYPLLSAQDVERVTKIANKVNSKFVPAKQMSSKRPWFKSMHAYIPEFHDVACHSAIVNRIKAILGPDIMVWGSCITIRKPGQIHRWHVDVEHRRWPGVSVFIGLEGISKKSTLKLISRSHKINALPQELNLKSDQVVLDKARELEPSSQLVALDLGVGEFFIFDGTLWHGSRNCGKQTRTAMVVQYSQPNARVEIPLNYNEPIEWSSFQPPCVLAAGVDGYGVNQLVSRPVWASGDAA